MDTTEKSNWKAHLEEYCARESARKDVEHDIIASFLLAREWELITELNTMAYNWPLWNNDMGAERKAYLERDLDTIRRLKSTLDKERWINDVRLSYLEESDYKPSEDLVSK